MPYLRALAFVSAMAAALVFVAPMQALARRRGWPVQHKIQTGFCRVVCAIIGIRVAPKGALPSSAPRFVVANHVSWTDIIALASLYPFVFLAKAEVANWPVLGLLARLQGTIFVRRGARAEIPRVNAALCETLRNGRDMVVFPEGTSSDGTQVLRFNPAHFDAVQSFTGEAVVAPVAIRYAKRDGAPVDVGWYGDMTFLPHLWALMKGGGVRCHIMFGDPVDARGKDRKSIAAETETQVRELLANGRGG